MTLQLLATRGHPAYIAFLVHRISGVGLALFLPLHFWVLGQAIGAGAELEAFLRWSDQPLVKLSETLLVGLLALHMAGGMRLLVLETFSGRAAAQRWIFLTFLLALLAATVFLILVFMS